MPKYDLIAEEIMWCKAHRNPEHTVYQDGFIAGLQHALSLMTSRPTKDAADLAVRPAGCRCASYVLYHEHHELCPLAKPLI
jgi:hypothetical protein